MGGSSTLASIPGIGTPAGLGTGSFDSTLLSLDRLSDRPVTQTQTTGPSFGIGLTQDGALLPFDPSAITPLQADLPSPPALPTGLPVSAFAAVVTSQAFAGGFLVVFTANADGSVSLLS